MLEMPMVVTLLSRSFLINRGVVQGDILFSPYGFIIALAIFFAGSSPNLLTILRATFFGFPVIEYPQFTFLVLSNPASFLASPIVEVIPLISLFKANLTFSVVVPFNIHFSGLSIK